MCGFDQGHVACVAKARRLAFQDVFQFQVAHLRRGIFCSAVGRHSVVYSIFDRFGRVVSVFQDLVVRLCFSVPRENLGLRCDFFFRISVFLLSQLADCYTTDRCGWWCPGVLFRGTFVWFGSTGVQLCLGASCLYDSRGRTGTGVVESVLVIRSSVAFKVVLGA